MRYESRHARSYSAPAPRRGRLAVIVIAAVLVLALAVGGTIAWLTTQTTGLVNTFTPSSVSCVVGDNSDGSVKNFIDVKNTGDINAYVRVKLVPYRTDADGNHIWGNAALPDFTLGSGWSDGGNGYYYYNTPIAPSLHTTNLLGSSIPLIEYGDADGGYLSIDVIAEAIQSEPAEAVIAAWGVNPGSLS